MIKTLWVEKYRPSHFSDIIGQDVATIQNLVKDPMGMTHLLLESRSPGTGKSSMANVIRNEIGCPKEDFMVMNSSEERKIETIRTIIKNFVQTKRTKTNVPRIIQMDEFDGMLAASQDAMRNLMETYSRNCKFILTANNVEKIIDPIRSRCVTIHMSDPPKEEIAKRLEYILTTEKVSFDKEGIRLIIDAYYPDMRSMINKLQELSFSEKGITKDIILQRKQVEEQLYDLLRTSRNVYKCREFIIQNNIDVESTLKFIIEKVVYDVRYSAQIREEIAFMGAEINYRMMVGSDKEIQMTAFIMKYLQLIPVEPDIN